MILHSSDDNSYQLMLSPVFNRKHLLVILALIPILMFCANPKQDNRKISKETPIQPADTVQFDKSVEEISDSLNKDNRTTQEMWTDFYAAKDSADSALTGHDFTLVKSLLKKAAFHAMEVERADIAAWQLNNIGYYAILEFKEITDYDRRMRKIEKMRRGTEKNLYIKQTKELFKDNFILLEDATKFLEEAYELDKDFRDSDRTEKIYNNLTFIDWIRNFSNDK